MPATRKDLITVVLVAFATTLGSNYGSSIAFPGMWRPSPFTGDQGKALAERCDALTERVEDLETGLPPKWLIDRIDRIELKADKCDRLLYQMMDEKK